MTFNINIIASRVHKIALNISKNEQIVVKVTRYDGKGSVTVSDETSFDLRIAWEA